MISSDTPSGRLRRLKSARIHRSCGIRGSVRTELSPISCWRSARAPRGRRGPPGRRSVGPMDTPHLMPAPDPVGPRHHAASGTVRKNGRSPLLGPDGKCQVSVRYVDGTPAAIETVVLSHQHRPEVAQNQLCEALVEVIKPALPAEMLGGNASYLINPPAASWSAGRTATPAPDRSQADRRHLRRQGAPRRQGVLSGVHDPLRDQEHCGQRHPPRV